MDNNTNDIAQIINAAHKAGSNTLSGLAIIMLRETLKSVDWLTEVRLADETIIVKDIEDYEATATKIWHALKDSSRTPVSILDSNDDIVDHLTSDSFLEALFNKVVGSEEWGWILEDIGSRRDNTKQFAAQTFVQIWLYGRPLFF